MNSTQVSGSAKKIQAKTVKFNQLESDSFLRDVKKSVNEYFKAKNIQKTANSTMILKTVFILFGWALTYFLIITNVLPVYLVIVTVGLHGFFTALIGLNIAHDAIHGSYSKSASTNKNIGLLFNLIGANDYVWKISHNTVHHTHTNIPDHDDDINQPAILRLEKNQKLRWIHRFQHIYAFAVYGLASLSWVFVKDYVKFFQKQLGSHSRNTFPRKEIIRLFTYKLLYYSIFLVVPLILVEFSWYWILAGFFFAHFIEGFTLAIIFMLAHIIEGTSFPEPDSNGRLNMSWAELQMRTTSNFATNNPLVGYISGGLNFQIEHHLFPNVCHVHYSNISKIVRACAAKHNLPYLEQKTFFGAVASHRRVLKRMGQS